MATLKIWGSQRRVGDLPLVWLNEQMTYQALTFSGVAAASSVIGDKITVVSVVADVDCAIRVGANPTATVNDYPVKASELRTFAVQPGQRISAIAV